MPGSAAQTGSPSGRLAALSVASGQLYFARENRLLGQPEADRRDQQRDQGGASVGWCARDAGEDPRSDEKKQEADGQVDQAKEIFHKSSRR